MIKGGLSPEYVLDKMERYEIESYISMLPKKNDDILEMVRLGCVCSLQPHSKKKINCNDIVKFPWEKEKEKVMIRYGNQTFETTGRESQVLEDGQREYMMKKMDEFKKNVENNRVKLKSTRL